MIGQTSHDLEPGCIHVWRIKLDKPSGDLAELLSADETVRAQAKKAQKERDRFILAHGAMRAILGQYLVVTGDKLEFVQGEKGKPALAYPDTDIQFNLTHCEDMALLALADANPVGIDLERIRSRPMQLKIAQRMFSPPIYQQLQQLPAEQFIVQFFQHWTELEARAKCLGGGIFSQQKGQSEITTEHFSPQDGWMACVAAQDVNAPTLELKHFLYRI